MRFFLSSGAFAWSVLLVLVFGAISVNGQNSDEQELANDIEILNKAELDLQLILSRQTFREADLAVRANRNLTDILKRNPATPLRERIEADLVPLQEILGKHNLLIAGFYLNRYVDGRNLLRGAESRLLEIVNKYPHFSRMDEVLFKLSTLSIRADRTADARTYLRQLICKYPESVQLEPAFDRLRLIGFGDWEGCDKLKQ